MPRNPPQTETHRTLTRRRVLVGTAAAGASAAAGLTLAAGDAAADVTFGELTIADATHEAPAPSPTPHLDVTAKYEYEVEAPDRVAVSLRVGDSDGLTTVDGFDTTTGSSSLSDSREFSAPVTAADAWSEAAFEPENESVTQTVTVALSIAVSRDGATVASARVEEAVDITVRDTAHGAEASIGGDGSVRFETPDG
jgi:hypothetical protein